MGFRSCVLVLFDHLRVSRGSGKQATLSCARVLTTIASSGTLLARAAKPTADSACNQASALQSYCVVLFTAPPHLYDPFVHADPPRTCNRNNLACNCLHRTLHRTHAHAPQRREQRTRSPTSCRTQQCCSTITFSNAPCSGKTWCRLCLQRIASWTQPVAGPCRPTPPLPQQ